MIMRADGVLRVILNAPLFKGMKIGSPTGDEPIGKAVNLSGMEDGKTVPLMLKVCQIVFASIPRLR
jgi:Ran-binding protein 3